MAGDLRGSTDPLFGVLDSSPTRTAPRTGDHDVSTWCPCVRSKVYVQACREKYRCLAWNYAKSLFFGWGSEYSSVSERKEVAFDNFQPKSETASGAEGPFGGVKMLTGCAPENLSTPVLVDGSLQSPTKSSASLGWNGVVVELYRSWPGRMVAKYPFHVVSLQLSGQRNLHQRRDGVSLRQTTRSGTIIVTPRGPEKEWNNSEQANCNFAVVNLSPSLFEAILAEREHRAAGSIRLLDNFGTRDARLERLVLSLLEEFRAAEFANGMYVESLANQLSIELLRRHSTLRDLSEVRTQRLPRSKLARAIDYIDENLCGDLTVKAIAALVSMSASHFARAFKQSTGVSPHHYVAERRHERAKSLLRETDQPIAEISQQLGYSAASHFCVSFQRYAGMTPRQYRRDPS
jgi:AraC family transcriptional regulator